MTAGELSGLIALPTALAGLVAALAKWWADVSSQRIARHEQGEIDERVGERLSPN